MREGRVTECLFLFLIPVNSLEEVLSTFFMYHCDVIGGEGPIFYVWQSQIGNIMLADMAATAVQHCWDTRDRSLAKM